ncbi:unnamed protein product [Aphanomyces euteiches]
MAKRLLLLVKATLDDTAPPLVVCRMEPQQILLGLSRERGTTVASATSGTADRTPGDYGQPASTGGKHELHYLQFQRDTQLLHFVQVGRSNELVKCGKRRRPAAPRSVTVLSKLPREL